MSTPVSNIVSSVRNIIDENKTTTQLVASDVQLNLDAIITEHIASGIQYIVQNAPSEMLGDGVEDVWAKQNAQSVAINGTTNYYSKVSIGSDVARVLAVKMSTWNYAVTDFAINGSDAHRQQYSRFAGSLATKADPIAVLTYGSSGREIHLFPSAQSGATVEVFRVIKTPDTSTISSSTDIEGLLNKKLVGALKYVVSALTLVSLGDGRADDMLKIANDLMSGDKEA